MKKIIFILILLINSMALFSDSQDTLFIIINDIVSANGGKNVEIIDTINGYFLVKMDYNFWQSTCYFIDIKNKTYFDLNNEPGHFISARFLYLEYINAYIIEFVGTSNQGNGFITLLDLSLQTLLCEYYYDSHHEDLSEILYQYYEKLENISGGNLSIIFRDNYSLNIEYNSQTIKIYGYRDYVLKKNDNCVETVLSEKIERYFNYNFGNNRFELIKEISSPDYFEWWNY